MIRAATALLCLLLAGCPTSRWDTNKPYREYLHRFWAESERCDCNPADDEGWRYGRN